MNEFKGKYRTLSNRMPGWDYAGNGVYFITLVVQNHDCVFGQIENQNMICNEWGIIATVEWFKSFGMRQELTCNAFVIMPNHLHAVVTIKKPTGGKKCFVEEDAIDETIAGTRIPVDPTSQPLFSRKPRSLSSFVAGYKAAVTTRINDWIDVHPNDGFEKFNRKNRLWQPNYYDHVVRNAAEFERIANYIIHNPANWPGDKFYDH